MYLFFLWVVYVRAKHYDYVFCVFFFFFFFNVSCFTYDTLIIDLYYEVIHGICLVVFCEIKKLIWFTCIFHTSIYAFV